MGQTYYKIYIHLIWRTKNREPFLQAENETIVNQIIKDKCHKFGFEFLASGNTLDHIHMLVAINPHQNISDFVAEVKGATAYQVNHHTTGTLYWQDGYGCISISESGLGKVKEYVLNQKNHHQLKDSLMSKFEMIGETGGSL